MGFKGRFVLSIGLILLVMGSPPHHPTGIHAAQVRAHQFHSGAVTAKIAVRVSLAPPVVIAADLPTGTYFNVRLKPTTTSRVVTTLHAHDSVIIIRGLAGDTVSGNNLWYLVYTGHPLRRGYILSTAITAIGYSNAWTAQVSNDGVVVPNALPAYAGPSISSTLYTSFDLGTRMTVLGTVRGQVYGDGIDQNMWYRVRTAAPFPVYMPATSLKFIVSGQGPLPLPHVTATSFYGEDLTTGRTLLTRLPDFETPIASLAKMMTALVAVESIPITTVLTVPAGIDQVTTLISGTSMGLSPGEKLTLHQLLYGLLLPSGNDAAMTIASGVAASQDAFVMLMNARARTLKMTHTYYTRPDGLDTANDYGSARDMATVARTVLAQPVLADIVGTAAYTITATAYHPTFPLVNTNQLLTNYVGTFGIKTGTTPAAGQCIVAAATSHGRRVLLVILHSSNRYSDAIPLLDYIGALARSL